jgi:hypothetical protein
MIIFNVAPKNQLLPYGCDCLRLLLGMKKNQQEGSVVTLRECFDRPERYGSRRSVQMAPRVINTEEHAGYPPVVVRLKCSNPRMLWKRITGIDWCST